MFWSIFLLVLAWIGDIALIFYSYCVIKELIETDHPCLAVMVLGFVLFITSLTIINTFTCFNV